MTNNRTLVPQPKIPQTREEEIHEDCKSRWRLGNNILSRKDERAYLYRALMDGELAKILVSNEALAKFDGKYDLWSYCTNELLALLRAANTIPSAERTLALLEAAKGILATAQWRLEECLGEDIALRAHYLYFDSLDDDE